jgi:hypothetical protein
LAVPAAPPPPLVPTLLRSTMRAWFAASPYNKVMGQLVALQRWVPPAAQGEGTGAPGLKRDTAMPRVPAYGTASCACNHGNSICVGTDGVVVVSLYRAVAPSDTAGCVWACDGVTPRLLLVDANTDTVKRHVDVGLVPVMLSCDRAGVLTAMDAGGNFVTVGLGGAVSAAAHCGVAQPCGLATWTAGAPVVLGRQFVTDGAALYRGAGRPPVALPMADPGVVVAVAEDAVIVADALDGAMSRVCLRTGSIQWSYPCGSVKAGALLPTGDLALLKFKRWTTVTGVGGGRGPESRNSRHGSGANSIELRGGEGIRKATTYSRR